MKEEAKLKAVEYWKWRTRIEEMNVSKKEVEIAQLNKAMMLKDIELKKVQAIILGNSIEKAQERLDNCKKNYDELKSEIESRIGMSLNNCGINEFDYTVKQFDTKEGESNGTGKTVKN